MEDNTVRIDVAEDGQSFTVSEVDPNEEVYDEVSENGNGFSPLATIAAVAVPVVTGLVVGAIARPELQEAKERVQAHFAEASEKRRLKKVSKLEKKLAKLQPVAPEVPVPDPVEEPTEENT